MGDRPYLPPPPVLPEHPLTFLLDIRPTVTPRGTLRCASAYPAPELYNSYDTIIMPTSSPSTSYGCVRLEDVVRFQAETAKKLEIYQSRSQDLIFFPIDNFIMENLYQEVKSSFPTHRPAFVYTPVTQEWRKDGADSRSVVSKPALTYEQFAFVEDDSCREWAACSDKKAWDDLKTSYDQCKAHPKQRTAKNLAAMAELGRCIGPREVLYRVTHNVWPGQEKRWLLEACHFEVFVPDRLDLRLIYLEIRDVIANDYFDGQLLWISAYNIELLPYSNQLQYPGESVTYAIQWYLARPGRPEVIPPAPAPDPSEFVQTFDISVDPRWRLRSIADYSFPVHDEYRAGEMENDRRIDGRKGIVEERSAGWTYPVEPVRNVELYNKLVRTLHGFNTMHGVCITNRPRYSHLPIRDSEEREMLSSEYTAKSECTLRMQDYIDAARSTQDYTEHHAFIAFCDGLGPVLSVNMDQPSPYPTVCVSFPPWVTDRRFFLWITQIESTPGHQGYFCHECPMLTALMDQLNLREFYFVRVMFTATPFLLLRALLRRKEDFSEQEFISGGLTGKGAACFKLIGKKRSINFQFPFNEELVLIPLETDVDPVTGYPRSRPLRAARTLDQSILLLGKKGYGKSLALADIACLIDGRNKLIVTRTRADARKISLLISKINNTTQPNDKFDDTDILKREQDHGSWKYFHRARADIIVATVHTYLMFHYYAGVSPDCKRIADLPIHTLLIDNFECMKRDELYMLVKLCQNTKLIMAANYRPTAPDYENYLICRMVEAQNVYVSVLPPPPNISSFNDGRFFYPLSRFHATESDRRFVRDVEVPAIREVLRWCKDLKDAKYISSAVLATDNNHKMLLDEFLQPAERKVTNFTPDELDGNIASNVIVVLGRNPDRYINDQFFMRLISSLHVCRLILIGTSAPKDEYSFKLLTEESQLVNSNKFLSVDGSSSDRSSHLSSECDEPSTSFRVN